MKNAIAEAILDSTDTSTLPSGPTPVPSDPAGGVTPPATPVPPSAPDYVAIAAQVNDLLAQMIALVPDLEASTTAGQHALTSLRSVPLPFVDEAIQAAQEIPELGHFVNMDEAGASLLYAENLQPVAVKIAKFARNLAYSADAKKAEGAKAALQIYSTAQLVAKSGNESSQLAAAIETMRAKLGKAGRKKVVAPATPPATPPAPQPPVSAPASANPPEAPLGRPHVTSGATEVPAPTVYVSTNPPGGNR